MTNFETTQSVTPKSFAVRHASSCPETITISYFGENQIGLVWIESILHHIYFFTLLGIKQTLFIFLSGSSSVATDNITHHTIQEEPDAPRICGHTNVPTETQKRLTYLLCVILSTSIVPFRTTNDGFYT